MAKDVTWEDIAHEQQKVLQKFCALTHDLRISRPIHDQSITSYGLTIADYQGWSGVVLILLQAIIIATLAFITYVLP